MRTLNHIIHLMAAAASLWLLVACAGESDPPVLPVLPDNPAGPDTPQLTNLVIDLRVSGTPAAMSVSRADASDRNPAGDQELMHTLRIIIFAADGHVEHNGRYDLTMPVARREITIAVPNAEAKKIIFIANEDYFTVVDPATDESVPAAEYFSSLYPTVTATEGNTFTGTKWTQLQNVSMRTADNPVFSKEQLLEKERIPVPASAIYENVVIPRQPTYSRTFYLHRAATKYTYRLTNSKSSASVVVNKAKIRYVATSQYLFPHVTWRDTVMLDSFSDYDPLATRANSSAKEYTINVGIDDKETRDFIVYLPEGTKLTNEYTYQTGLLINSYTSKYDWHDIKVGADDKLNPGSFTPMRTLPRNTNVIINGDIQFRATGSELVMNYTVCKWWNYETDIPPYN